MLMTRFCEVVVWIDIAEKSEIWSTRESRKPAPVFAADSTKDIERDCLIIGVEFRGREDDARAIVPATISAASWCDRVELLRDHAIVLMIERFKSSVSCHHDPDLFLCSGSSHRRGQRSCSHGVSFILFL